MKDWRTLLYERWDPEKSKYLSNLVSQNLQIFEEVFNAFYSEDGHLAHRSGFILGQVFRKKPQLLIPKIELLLAKMNEPPNQWYRWMTIMYLSHCKLPVEHDGLAATLAFEELENPSAKPAVKNASLRLLEFICKRNPELIPEYKLYLEEIMEHERPTLVAKAKKQMKALNG
ncbi:MAG: hypothetical protein JKX84_00365 [Flavobacteriales bacterium]|nr:hypothetical protein [Flavobacteriales bacterium]